MAKRVNGDAGAVLTVGILAIGGFLLYKFFGSGGGTGTGQNNADIDKNTGDSTAKDLAASLAAGIQQQVPDSTLNGYADSLYQLLGNGGGPPVDSGTAAQVDGIVTQVNNSTDWFRLLQLFGTKKYNSGGAFSACGLTGFGCDSYDLVSLLRLTMPAQNLANINSYFSDQGINVYI